MKSINFKIAACFTIKTLKLNVTIHDESAEVHHVLFKSYFGPALLILVAVSRSVSIRQSIM